MRNKASFSRLVATHCVSVSPFSYIPAYYAGIPARIFMGCYLPLLFFYIFHVAPCDKGTEQHGKKNPKLASVLPKAGILIKRSHDSSFEKLEYCIVSGIYNSWLARVQLLSL